MSKTFTPTVIIISAYAGEDYFNETKAGYSERDAYWAIREGQIDRVQQVLLISDAGCDDITAAIAEKIAGDIRDGELVAESAGEFAQEHGGYVPRLTRAEIAEQRAEYWADCAREDRI